MISYFKNKRKKYACYALWIVSERELLKTFILIWTIICIYKMFCCYVTTNDKYGQWLCCFVCAQWCSKPFSVLCASYFFLPFAYDEECRLSIFHKTNLFISMKWNWLGQLENSLSELLGILHDIYMVPLFEYKC